MAIGRANFLAMLNGADPNDAVHSIQCTSAHQFLIRNTFNAKTEKGAGGLYHIAMDLSTEDYLVLVPRPELDNAGREINQYLNYSLVQINWEIVDLIHYFRQWAELKVANYPSSAARM